MALEYSNESMQPHGGYGYPYPHAISLDILYYSRCCEFDEQLDMISEKYESLESMDFSVHKLGIYIIICYPSINTIFVYSISKHGILYIRSSVSEIYRSIDIDNGYAVGDDVFIWKEDDKTHLIHILNNEVVYHLIIGFGKYMHLRLYLGNGIFNIWDHPDGTYNERDRRTYVATLTKVETLDGDVYFMFTNIIRLQNSTLDMLDIQVVNTSEGEIIIHKVKALSRINICRGSRYKTSNTVQSFCDLPIESFNIPASDMSAIRWWVDVYYEAIPLATINLECSYFYNYFRSWFNGEETVTINTNRLGIYKSYKATISDKRVFEERARYNVFQINVKTLHILTGRNILECTAVFNDEYCVGYIGSLVRDIAVRKIKNGKIQVTKSYPAQFRMDCIAATHNIVYYVSSKIKNNVPLIIRVDFD
jgi:hypothetical protein